MIKSNKLIRKSVIGASDFLVGFFGLLLGYRGGIYLSIHLLRITNLIYYSRNKVIPLAIEILLLAVFITAFVIMARRDDKLRNVVFEDTSSSNLQKFTVNSFLGGLSAGLCLTVLYFIVYTFF